MRIYIHNVFIIGEIEFIGASANSGVKAPRTRHTAECVYQNNIK